MLARNKKTYNNIRMAKKLIAFRATKENDEAINKIADTLKISKSAVINIIISQAVRMGEEKKADRIAKELEKRRITTSHNRYRVNKIAILRKHLEENQNGME